MDFKIPHCHHLIPPKTPCLNKKAFSQLVKAAVFCFLFILAEVVGGLLANSLAIAADAAHLFTDLISFTISIVALKIALKPSSEKYTFGWYRAEVLGALISVFMIWLMTMVLLFLAIMRIITRNFEIDAKVMMITAGLGVTFNIIMLILLGPSSGNEDMLGRKESEDYLQNSYQFHRGISRQNSKTVVSSEDETSPLVKEKDFWGQNENFNKPSKSVNVRAAFIHVIGDLIQSLVVLSASFIIYYKPHWKIVDPICTFVFSILVLFTTINILRDIFHILMEGSPKQIQISKIKSQLKAIKGVMGVHDVKIWSLTGSKTVFLSHISLESISHGPLVLLESSLLLQNQYRFHEVYLQLEQSSPEMTSCQYCK